MVEFPRLRYSQTYPLSLSATLAGGLVIFAAVAASVLATVFTKGRVSSTEIHYLANFTQSGFVCNSTLIYPGEPFGGPGTNSTFVYITQNRFAYEGQSLGQCKIRPGATLTFSNLNEWPEPATYEYSIACELNASSNATFAVTKLNSPSPNDVGILSEINAAWDSQARAVNSVSIADPMIVTGYFFPNMSLSNLRAMEIDVDAKQVTSYWSGSTLYNNINSTYLFDDVKTLIEDVEASILADFNSSANGVQLFTSVLYPCTSANKVWASKWTLLWECYTSAAATLSPAVAIVTWILIKVTANSPSGVDSTYVHCPQCSSPARKSCEGLDGESMQMLHPSHPSPTSTRMDQSLGYSIPEPEWEKGRAI